MTLDIPLTDQHAFSKLPSNVRDEVKNWIAVLRPAVDCPRGQNGVLLGFAAAQMGTSWKTARRQYDNLRRDGWRGLINKAKHQDWRSNLPVEIVVEYRRVCELYQRNSRAGWRAMMRDWRNGKLAHLPWPAMDAGTKLPRGCTYANLQHLASSRFELTAMRQGLGRAMSDHGPQLIKTRVGLWVGSHYLIDDVTRDMKVMLLSNGGQIARVQELGVFDLFSGDRFAVHRRPEFERADGKKDRLKEAEMRFLIAAVLRNNGYSPKGTEFVSEKGTAVVREALVRWMRDHVSDKITVKYPGDIGRLQAIAGWQGRGGGNPKHKAALESHHNLIHNEAGAMLAQTGHDRSHPEWLFGIERQTTQVLRWMNQLPPDRAAMLQVGMYEYWQALSILGEIDRLIAYRTDHELEGWEQCGFTTLEFRRDLLRDEWMKPEEFLSLPDGEQLTLRHAANAYPGFARARKLAPREVFASGAQTLCTVPDCVIALLFCDRNLGDDLRVTRKVGSDGTLTVSNSEAEPGEMIFERTVITPENGEVRLSDREKYGVVLNVFDRSALWVYDDRGGFIGTAPRRNRVSPLDDRAIEIELGRIAHQKAALVAPLRERHAGMTAQIADMQRHNERVRMGLPVTAEEHRAADTAADRVTDINAFIDQPTQQPKPLAEFPVGDFQPQTAPANADEFL